MSEIDPVTLAVVRARLEQIATEIHATFVRTAFSPVISEAQDVAGGIYDGRDGTVVAQGERSMPIFVASMQFAVQHLMTVGDWQRGDVAMTNDPYLGGTHLPDVKMITPFFHRDELFAFLGSAGHWADIGGASPGGFNSRASEIYQEGVRIPAVKIVERGKVNLAALQLLMANVRIPEQRLGDFEAQLLSLEAGQRRAASLLDAFGGDVVRATIDELSRRSEEMCRARLREIPNGTYEADEILDGDGISSDPVRIHVSLTFADGTMTADFSGSDPPCEGPINAAYSTTVSAVMVALKHLFPELPVNAGTFRAVHVIAPESTFLNASFSRPVAAAAAEVSQRVIEALFKALAKAVPRRARAASAATVTNIALGGTVRDQRYVLYTYSGGGYGASASGDGLSFGCALVGSATTPPIEVYEALYPIRVNEFALVEGSAGAGTTRGGFGARIEYELIDGDAEATVMGDRGRAGPEGILGGLPGTPNRVVFRLNGTEFVPPHLTKIAGVRMRPGDRIRIETPGGGGYGPPADRDAEAVSSDLADQYYTPQFVADIFGVGKQ